MKPMQIHVTLVDAETGNAFGEMYSPIGKMPKVFEPGKTTLNLQGALWVVVKAEPSTADEYIRTGKVAVTIEKVQRLPARNILYTLPTICDNIPRVQSMSQEHKDALPVVAMPADLTMLGPGSIRPKAAYPEGNIYRIHEDYWRGIEFISLGHQKDIEAEMDEIRLIYRDHRNNSKGIIGFTKIHLRKRIHEPIVQPFRFDDLLSIMPTETHKYIGIGYGGTGSMESEGLIESGFAFQMGPAAMYGVHNNGLVKVLCLHNHGEKFMPSQVIAALIEKIMLTNNLALIDWCRGVALSPGAGAVQSYIEKVFF
jgi:hypothetical protein